MKEIYFLKTLAVIIILFTALYDTSAQVPQGFNYQAVLRNPDGTIMQNHNVTIQFSIHRSTLGGNIVYQEFKDTTTNNFGLVNLQIGKGNPNVGTFSSIQWGTNSYFLQVWANIGTGLVDLGTTQFLSVPYSMVADTALHVADGGNAGGDLSGTYPNPTVAKIQTVAVSGTAPTNGQVLQYNGTSWTPTTQTSSGWSLTGNAGTVDGTNFIGTTDNVAFNFRVNNQKAGRIDVLGPTFLGYKAGNNNTAVNSTGIGFNALYSNTTGYGNTATGDSSLSSNTSGNDNSAYGVASLFNTTTGSFNTAYGFRSLYYNTTGTDNTAIGDWSLYHNTTGSANTANGLKALYSNTTGSNNNAYGENALSDNTTGSDNTALGYTAGFGQPSVNFNQCTFIGNNSYPTQNRTNVTMLGYGIFDAQCTGNNQVCVGNTAITATGLRAAVTGWTAYSDARFKTNVKENVMGLDFILKLKPVTFNVRPKELHKIWNTPDSLVNKMDFSEAEKETRIGFVAQDVEKAAKECGFNFPGIDVPRNDKEVYTLRYVDFIMPMVKALQELNTHNVEQQKMIEELQKQIAALQAQINNQQSHK